MVSDGKPLTIGPVCRTDADDLCRNCFPERDPTLVRDYLDWCCAQMSRERMVRLVAKVDGTAIGNGQVSFWRGRGEIGSLVVAASFRQRGIGDELLAALIEQGRSRGLAVLELWADPTCQWLQTWYRRRGFCPVETRMLPHDERVVVLRMALGIAGE